MLSADLLATLTIVAVGKSPKAVAGGGVVKALDGMNCALANVEPASKFSSTTSALAADD